MIEVIEALYRAGFTVWDKCINLAGDLFSKSPRQGASSDLSSVAYNFYAVTKGCAIPLATLFFIIAIYKSVVSSQPEQALKKFLSDAIRYVLILFVVSKLDSIIDGIMTFSENMSSLAGMASESNLESSPEVADLIATIESLQMQELHNVDVMDFASTIEVFFNAIGPYILYFIAGVITLLVLVGSSVSVLGIAYQRIFKPLIMIPLSTIVLSMSCCSGEGSKMMWSLGKTFLGLCISGAFFVVAINMGAKIGTSLISSLEPTAYSGRVKDILTIVRVDTTAIIVTGLLKSIDAMVQKAFG